MTHLQQTLILYVVLQLIFGFYEYQAEGDVLGAVTKLFQSKYLIATFIICSLFFIGYPIFTWFIKWLIAPF